MNPSFLLISDIHLDNWPRNSPEKDYRMRTQPLMLAKRITEVMKEQHTNHIFILGDLINQWTAAPQIMGVLADFYRSLIKDNPNIYIGYILGQHDMRYYDDYSEDNSYVHIVAKMFPDNVHYLHDQYMTFPGSNTELYFSSFNRKKPIYPEHHVNVFLSHLSFGFVEIDNKCADLIVAGDIHDFYDEGNCHSVGLPYQLYSHQPKDGVIGVVHCDGAKSTYERIKSDSKDFEFLKFDPIVKRTIEKDSEHVDELKLDNSDIMHMIEEEVVKHGVEDVHHEIPMNNLPAPINFRFKLKRIIIDNVRSIDHLELDLESLAGVNYIKGCTGAGKSSIFYSIITALVGADKEELLRKTNKVTGGALQLQLWLEYEGHRYCILRNVQETRMSIDGEIVQCGKRDTQKKILECLPFISYWQYFYIQANKHYFDSINKTELMRVLFNLKIFDYLFTKSKALLKTTNAALRSNKDNLIAKRSTLETLQSTRKDYEANIALYSDISIDMNEVDNLMNKERSLNIEASRLHSDVENLKNNALRLKSELDSLKEAADYNVEELTQQLSEISAKIANANQVNKEYESLVSQKITLESKLNTLRSVKITKCPHCGGVLHGQDEQQINETEQKLQEIVNLLQTKSMVDTGELKVSGRNITESISRAKQYEIKRAEQEKMKNAYSDLKAKACSAENMLQEFYTEQQAQCHEEFYSKMSDLKIKLAKREQLKQNIQRCLDQENSLNSNIETLSANTKELEQKAAQIVKYNELFNIQELSSIPYSILSKLVKYLNTDTVKFESSLNGEDFNITASIHVGDQDIAYEEASDGQKNYLDMFILIRITKFLSGDEPIGLIIMDEPLVNLDPSYIDEASQLIPEISANTIFISSHTQFDGYDRLISVTRDERGITNVSLM